jgi:hypothetical protein
MIVLEIDNNIKLFLNEIHIVLGWGTLESGVADYAIFGTIFFDLIF